MSRKIRISFIVVILLGAPVWCFFLRTPGPEAKAKELAARALIGKPQFPDNVSAHVKNNAVSYTVYFTHPVSGGRRGEVYPHDAV